jgi:hypothetical protein
MRNNSAIHLASFVATADCTIRQTKATAASLPGLLEVGPKSEIDCASVETVDTRIVVIEVKIDGDPVTLWLIADEVYEVTEISTRQILEFVIVPDMSRILG